MVLMRGIAHPLQALRAGLIAPLQPHWALRAVVLHTQSAGAEVQRGLQAQRCGAEMQRSLQAQRCGAAAGVEVQRSRGRGCATRLQALKCSTEMQRGL